MSSTAGTTTSPSSTETTASSVSSSASPTSTCNSTGNLLCGLPTSGTLYLFTFLSALICVLVIGGLIVGRSMYRRHYIRRHGVPPPPAAGEFIGRRARADAGPKQRPLMYDLYIDVDEDGDAKYAWDGIMPVAATLVRPNVPSHFLPWKDADDVDTRPVPQTTTGNTAILPGPGAGAAFFMALARLFTSAPTSAYPQPREIPRSLSGPLPPVPASSASASVAAPVPLPPPHALRIACVLAMPFQSPAPSAKNADLESHMPLVEIGVADVPVPGDLDLQAAPKGSNLQVASDAEDPAGVQASA